MNKKKKEKRNSKDSDDLIDIVIQLNLTNLYRTIHSIDYFQDTENIYQNRPYLKP